MRVWLLLWALGSAWLAHGGPPAEIVVASYNLANYLGEDAPPAGPRAAKPKPPEEIAAITQVIREISPDILGVCEMGSPAQLAALQSRLREAGLDLPETEYVEAADTQRHLALLSRFPIVARQSRPDVSYDLNGRPRKVERGFLDVTVQVNAQYALRLVGVHLKSKLASPEGEGLIRRHEAALLRKHLDAILEPAPETNLLVYGDFNDTREQPVIREITGARGTPHSLAEVPTVDAVGDRWTHYYPAAEVYARIDFLFASRGLMPELVRKEAHIYRKNGWEIASDHRAIWTKLRPVNRAR